MPRPGGCLLGRPRKLRLVPDTAAVPADESPAAPGGAGAEADAVSEEAAGGVPWLLPAHGKGHLRPRSNPAVLPADILIADNHNNRLVVVDPQGRVRWRFPRPGDLAPGQHFRMPDDAFFSPNGRYIIATEEDYSVISVISVAQHKIIYRYGRPGVPGSAAGLVSNPDDAMMMPGGGMITADIKNCRIPVACPARPPHAPATPGHRRHRRLRAQPAARVRQPERRVPSHQRQLHRHRDHR